MRHRVDDSALLPSTRHRTAPRGQQLAAGREPAAMEEPDSTAAEDLRTEVERTGAVHTEAAHMVAAAPRTEGAHTAAVERPAVDTVVSRVRNPGPGSRLVPAATPEPAVLGAVPRSEGLEPLEVQSALVPRRRVAAPRAPGMREAGRPEARKRVARTSAVAPRVHDSSALLRSRLNLQEGFPETGSPEGSSSTGLEGDSS